MSSFEFEGRSLREMIAVWLEATPGVKMSTGLEVEEAMARARQLLPLVAVGALSGRDVRLDDDFKSVLYGLVRLVTEPPVAATPPDAGAVHRFISEVPWCEDLFGEKNDLLRRCAAATNRSANQAGSRDAAAPQQEDARPEKVFEAALPLIRTLLLGHYEFPEQEASALEDDLKRWFFRYCSRSGAARRNLKGVLLAACGQFAREYESYRVGAPVPSE